ncbi:clusterin-like protein 1 [Pelodytes ibericus]
MKSLIVIITSLLWLRHLQAAPTSEEKYSIDSKKIKALSKFGEQYVEQEVKNALMGVKQMKKIMEKNEEKHENILKSLRKTTEEKMEAVKLFEDISERLSQAEIQCKEMLTTAWDKCKACLEKRCVTLYTTTCSHQGFQSFVTKVQDIFKEWSPFTLIYQDADVRGLIERSDKDVAQLTQADKSFNQMMSDVSDLFNQSMQFLKNVHHGFDRSFQNFFMTDVKFNDEEMSTTGPNNEPITQWDISGWVQSFCDFSQALFEGVTDAVVKIFQEIGKKNNNSSIPLEESSSHFENLRSVPNKLLCEELQNSTGCLQFQEKCQLCYERFLKDCPDVLELHVKSEAAYKLVNLSAQQYEDLIDIVQQHTEDTTDIVTEMKERFGWVAEHTNMTHGADHIFSIEKVSFCPSSEYATLNETIVEVNVLSSSTLAIRVPGRMDVESPEFIQYVAEKALELYKKNF